MKKRILLLSFLITLLTLSMAGGAEYWLDSTTAKMGGNDGSSGYMTWSPVKPDASGTVTKVRVSVALFGFPTEVRVALYDQGGAKVTEGAAVVRSAGYNEIPVAPVRVSQGMTYSLAIQAASEMLYKFDIGGTTGGMEGPNSYAGGLPARLPVGWGGPLLTAGIYLASDLVAGFSATPDSGVAPLSVSFTDTSVGNPTSWSWDFGDGQTSTMRNPVHQYQRDGVYAVTLTVGGANGSASFTTRDCVAVARRIISAPAQWIHVDPAIHQKFGLDYPVTYKFSIPPNSERLSAEYSHSYNGSWAPLPEKTAADIFNGIEAVRFDYPRGIAYVSVRFSRGSNDIYLRILDAARAPVPAGYLEIPKYYDDRRAAVAVTLDDITTYNDDSVTAAVDRLAAMGLYFTIAVITKDANWPLIQSYVDKHTPYIEVASHSQTHKCSAADYTTLGYDTELLGSRDAILNNLNLPGNPYVSLYVNPCGYSDPTLEGWVTTGKYLLTRGVTEGTTFAPWDPVAGRYGMAGTAFDDWNIGDDPTLLPSANSRFDAVKGAGGIYTVVDHPWKGYWRDGTMLMQHLDYVKGRPDVWYAPLGPMYQYHLVQELKNSLPVKDMAESAPPMAQFSAGPVSGDAPLSVAFSDSSAGTVTGWHWDFGDHTSSDLQNPRHVFTAPGSYTVTLTASGPGGSTTKTISDFLTVKAAPPVVGSWSDVTTVKGIAIDGSGYYMMWSPFVADAGGTVTKLRASIRLFGFPTEMRLALYDENGSKLTEGTAVATKEGYQEVPVPPVVVTAGKKYYLASQAASDLLYRFDASTSTGGFEAPCIYSAGFPKQLPEGWQAHVITAGMFVQ